MAKKTKKKTTSEKQKEQMEHGSVLSASYSHSNQTRKIIEWFKEGLTDKEIMIKILQTNPSLKETSAQVYLDSARASFKEEYLLTRKFNIIQHVKRYDKDIAILAQFEPKTASYAKYQYEKGKAYADMVELLQKKERVLGFHRKQVKLKIKNTVNISVTKVQRSFDFTALSWEEKLALYNLVTKAWINPNEKLTLKPNPKHLGQEVVEDIEAEIVEETAETVVSLIPEKEDNQPIWGSEDPVEEIVPDKNIINAVKEKKESKDLTQLRNNLLNQILSK